MKAEQVGPRRSEPLGRLAPFDEEPLGVRQGKAPAVVGRFGRAAGREALEAGPVDGRPAETPKP